MTAITDKKLRDKLMKENKLELKKAIELIIQNTYEKKNTKNDTGGTNFGKRRKKDEKRTDTKNRKVWCATEKQTANRPCRFCGAPNGTPIHKCPAIEIATNVMTEMKHQENQTKSIHHVK